MATHRTVMAMGEEEPMGTTGLCPAALSQSTVAISYLWGSLGRSRAPSLSTPLGKVRTVLTPEDSPHQQ